MKNSERLKIAERELHRIGISPDNCELKINGGFKILISEKEHSKMPPETIEFFNELNIQIEFYQ